MASSQVMFRPGVLDNVDKQRTTVGRVRKPVQVKILDENGKTVEFNEIGQIYLKSADQVRGYLGKDDLDWLDTGDLGSLDEDGYLTLKGRLKDRIVLRNTKKIQSTEIEEMIIKVNMYRVPLSLKGLKVGGILKDKN